MTLMSIAMACSTNYAFAQIPLLFPSNGSHAVTTNITKVSPTTATSVQVSRLNFSKASGNIASLQNNAYPWDPWHLQFSKSAIWVLSGKWNLLIANTTSSSSSIIALGSPVFNASFSMVRLNGTGLHKHLISEFKPTEAPRFNATDNSTKFSGTSTVTMKNGPVKDVPTNITMSANRTIRIVLNPIMTAHHFGWEPIYGVVTKVK